MQKHFIKSIFLVIILALFTSCNGDKDSNKVIIKIETVIKENDSIRVFYTSDNSIDFKEEQAVWKKTDGSIKNQEIVIEIPNNILPNQLRIDFGNNILNQEIVLNKICVSYLESTFEAKGEEIYWYFRPDENNTTLDKNNGVLKRKNPRQLNGPSIYPKGDKLKEQLNKLYNKGANAK
ncbi:hypothetical protein [uncultured Flavobacterium sp.]|uniref:hypothetical protein n=1 Tax=uncultured Flavobacterium sp. TaxID=165435 RepID=UPI0030C836E7